MIILIISSYILIKDFLEQKNSKNIIVNLAKEVIIEEQNDEESIDWNKLKTINEDIIGWIKIENTNINYPIPQDNDNLKYLNHSFDKKYNKSGSIFTIDKNPFDDDETTLYGHNMKTNIMFSELANYMRNDYFYEHQNFIIYTEKQNYKATIFSCYSIGIYDEEKNLKSLSFEEKIEYYKKISKISTNRLGKIKKIVKLSTCSYLNNLTVPTNQRYYIIAKLEIL